MKGEKKVIVGAVCEVCMHACDSLTASFAMYNVFNVYFILYRYNKNITLLL